ncbi:MAG: YeeE/YedE family protein [Melioribacteraceae bacterium]|nr:YeeE/YedE family protein [Melioribacteraceae bacterium]
MGPLVPDVIGNELNFVVALFIGIAFGFILEQAGFSTSKKLVGLFYGYDFTVLRVFFTAGITGMIGLVIFAHFGLIDLNLIYVNPTFLYSALVGGFIMGLGFVIGGFCPGTSFCAAAIGKIDAIYFIGGSAIGVLLFGELYPILYDLYMAENWGMVTVYDLLGTSHALVAFAFAVMAAGAFWFTRWVELRVNNGATSKEHPLKLYYAVVSILFVMGLSAFLLPSNQESVLDKANNPEIVNSIDVNYITSDELAFRLIDNDNNLQIIDFRPSKEFNEMSLPKSIPMTFKELFGKDAVKTIAVKKKLTVFVAADEKDEKKASIIASELGFENVRILKGGMSTFKAEILDFKAPTEVKTNQEKDTARFRAKATVEVAELIKNNKKAPVEKKKSKRIIGGC